jgi:hypothetical protein
MASSQTIIPVERIASRIYLMRGEKVMLDGDLAELYGVETGVLVRAVKRNSNRFPQDFSFRLNNFRIRKLEMPNWHLKSMGRSTLPALCLYRTGCRHVVQRFAQRPRGRG